MGYRACGVVECEAGQGDLKFGGNGVLGHCRVVVQGRMAYASAQSPPPFLEFSCDNVGMARQDHFNVGRGLPPVIHMSAEELTLPMHASHGDIEEYGHGDQDDPDQFDDIHNDMYEDKVGQAKESGLYESIAANGVLDPVHVSFEGEKPEVLNGHKRVFSAFDINSDMKIPVQPMTSADLHKFDNRRS